MSGFSSPSGGDGGSAPADWPFVTVAEAARMVPYSERWIRKKVEKGLLRAWYEEQDGKEVLVVNKNETALNKTEMESVSQERFLLVA